MDWDNGVLFAKSAQGQSKKTTRLVDMTQASPVIGPWMEGWPTTVYHGTKSTNVQSIAQRGIDD
eukprot:5536611-Alexandrium_andersonii.AAC.1